MTDQEKTIRTIPHVKVWPRALSVVHLIPNDDYDALRDGGDVKVSAVAAAFFIAEGFCEEVKADA